MPGNSVPSQLAGSYLSIQPSLSPAKNSWLTSGAAPRVLIFLQILCQFILLSGAGSAVALRPIVRTGTFATSLLFLLVIPRSRMSAVHPATRFGLAIIAILGLSMFNPLTNSWLGGLAHASLYLAILSPLFWVHRLPFDAGNLRKLFLTIWLFYTLSSVVGVLQFAYPGRFQASLSSKFDEAIPGYIESLMIPTAGGDMVFRPMGLTDSPGGAAIAGFYALLIGLGFFLTSRKIGMKVLCVASMCAGMTCLYVSQVRVAFVQATLCLLVLLGILIRRGRIAKLGVLLAVAIAVLGSGFLLAHRLGGGTIFDRLFTLTEESPLEVYQKNRGVYLDYTVNELLPSMPLGGGLGRWGMINNYFGNPQDTIYVEIQWTGWVIDGGAPLIIAYVLALLAAVWFAWKTAMSRDERFWVWGAVLLAYDLAACASTFNNAFFMSQSGMEFWLLNAALFAAVRTAKPVRVNVAQPSAQPIRVKAAPPMALPRAVPGRSQPARVTFTQPIALPPPVPPIAVPQLPQSAVVTSLSAMPRDPHTLFAYWDLDRASIFGSDPMRERAVYLRVLTTDGVEESRTGVEPVGGNRYITVLHANTAYRLELGYEALDGDWHPLATSEPVSTTSDTIAEEKSAATAAVTSGSPTTPTAPISLSGSEEFPLSKIDDLPEPESLAGPTPISVPTGESASTTAPAIRGGNEQVWVNTESHVYYKEGSRWYGKTKKGKYMNEADALKEGNRAPKRGG